MFRNDKRTRLAAASQASPYLLLAVCMGVLIGPLPSRGADKLATQASETKAPPKEHAPETKGISSKPESVRVMFMNMNNYLSGNEESAKPANSQQACADMLATAAPDIAIFAELGGEESLADLLRRTGDFGERYTYRTIVKAQDKTRHLAVVSRFAPADVRHDVTSTYNIGDTEVPVRRGFAHCVFTFGSDYTLHVVGAHLKSKVYHYLGQTDMRRYEARQLRYLVNDLIEENPEANVLVMGDMNDSPQSSPIKSIIYRRFGTEKELFDLRPADKYDLVWTHYWDDEDTYARIDYAFTTYYLLPEIDFERTFIASPDFWRLASDHRPVVVTVRPGNKPASEEETLSNFYNNMRCNYMPKTSAVEEGRIAPQAR